MNKKHLYNVHRVFFDRRDNIITSIPMFNPCIYEECEKLIKTLSNDHRYKNGVTYIHVIEEDNYRAKQRNNT